MSRNDQAVRQLLVLKRLESARHGLTLAQLTDGLAVSAPCQLRTLRRDLESIESAG
jgi:predicted DNA-binding transcriptional regulator YafY